MSVLIEKELKQSVVTSTLQQALVDLTELHLRGKQMHWCIKGRGFRSLHLFLDEIIDTLRENADEVAERLVTIDIFPDGRAKTVAETNSLTELSAGRLEVNDVYRQYGNDLTLVADLIYKKLEAIDEIDSVSGDILRGITGGLQKFAWMLNAENQ